MLVQVNAGAHIKGSEALELRVRGAVESALDRVSDHITRVEVHLSDENGDKRGQNDKRCVMEARVEGRQPVAVTNDSDTFDRAIEGAADKLNRLITSTLERLHDKRGHVSDQVPPEAEQTERS